MTSAPRTAASRGGGSPGGRVVVVGGAAVDVVARSHTPPRAGTSNPGVVTTGLGGVGRNIAENLARLGRPVTLVSRVASDPLGAMLLERTAAAGVDVGAVATDATATAAYVAWLADTGDLTLAVSDFAAVEGMTPALLEAVDPADVACVVVDGNLPEEVAQAALDLAATAGARVVVEPVSVAKAARLSSLVARHEVWMVTPNEDEVEALTGGADPATLATHVWVRRGPRGSTLHTGADAVDLPSLPPPGSVRDVTGAGDAMTAALVDAVLRGIPVERACRIGHRAAALTVTVDHAVHPGMIRALVDPEEAP